MLQPRSHFHYLSSLSVRNQSLLFIFSIGYAESATKITDKQESLDPSLSLLVAGTCLS